MNKKNRIILLAAMLVAAVSQTFAQGNGLAGINEATSMVTSYFDPGTKLIYAIGAVVGLIGGIKVYGSHRRHQGVWQVLIWRPRHEQDCRKLVRSLHLPHRERNHPPLVLLII